MKRICLLLVTTCCVWAAPDDPGKTALQFIEKVRDKKLNLAPGADTAISPQTIEPKRQEIARRLERMAGDLDHSTLEVGEVKTDGDFAAVLIRKFHGFNSQRLGVFPVALVKRGVNWIAAPVPASFENSGVGYNSTIRQRLSDLESWMLREQANDLEHLRAETSQRMRRKIEEKLSAETLRNLDFRQTSERFVTACEQRNLPEILGFMGGLETDLPEDWNVRLHSVESAFGSPDGAIRRPWRLLGAQEVLKVLLFQDEDEDSAYSVIACLDPKGLPDSNTIPQVEIVRLNLVKSKAGFWRVNPPSAFIQGDDDANFSGEDSNDSGLLGMFPAKLAMKFPLEPESSSEKAAEALHAALASPKPEAWVRLVQFKGDTDEVCENYGKAAGIWWRNMEPGSARTYIPLDFNEQGDMAVSACQVFDSRRADQFDLQYLYFEKTPMGWLWNPFPSRSALKPFDEWTGGQAARWQEHWQDRMLEENPVLERIAGPAPDGEEARRLVSSWSEANQRADLKAALRLAARLNTPDSPMNVIRNQGYEITGTKMSRKRPQVSSVKTGRTITAVGLTSETDGKIIQAVYPVVATPSGPRVLLEIDLAFSGSRTRDYLNEVSLKRLGKFSPEAAEELRTLFAEILGSKSPE